MIRRALAIFRTFPSNPDIIGKRHLREKVHFTHIAARRRVPLAGKGSFPPYRCTRKISCKDTGEMHANLQRNGGNGRKTACRSGQKTLISPTSLHEISQMQGYGGNARKKVRDKGDTPLCPSQASPTAESCRQVVPNCLSVPRAPSTWHERGVGGAFPLAARAFSRPQLPIRASEPSPRLGFPQLSMTRYPSNRILSSCFK